VARAAVGALPPLAAHLHNPYGDDDYDYSLWERTEAATPLRLHLQPMRDAALAALSAALRRREDIVADAALQGLGRMLGVVQAALLRHGMYGGGAIGNHESRARALLEAAAGKVAVDALLAVAVEERRWTRYRPESVALGIANKLPARNAAIRAGLAAVLVARVRRPEPAQAQAACRQLQDFLHGLADASLDDGAADALVAAALRPEAGVRAAATRALQSFIVASDRARAAIAAELLAAVRAPSAAAAAAAIRAAADVAMGSDARWRALADAGALEVLVAALRRPEADVAAAAGAALRRMAFASRRRREAIIAGGGGGALLAPPVADRFAAV
jgi:hypothetical protein